MASPVPESNAMETVNRANSPPLSFNSISEATSPTTDSPSFKPKGRFNRSSPARGKPLAEMSPEEKAAYEAERERKREIERAISDARKKQREDFIVLMQQMPELVFGGSVIFVKSPSDDARACAELETSRVIGVDFEWRPDFNAGQNNRLSLAQVCDGHRCYIWCLFRFKQPAKGLHRLLLNPDILKVGCGMRGSDLAKLDVSGLRVGTATPKKQKKADKLDKDDKNGKDSPAVERLSFKLPNDFCDVQDFRLGTNHDQSLPFTGLNHLLGFFLQHRPPNEIRPEKAQWHLIEKISRLQDYAVTDAYAVLLIWYQYNGHADILSEFLDRDDHFIQKKLVDANFISLESVNALSNSAQTSSAPFSSYQMPTPIRPIYTSPSPSSPSSASTDTQEITSSTSTTPSLSSNASPRTKVKSPSEILPIQVSFQFNTPLKLHLRQEYSKYLHFAESPQQATSQPRLGKKVVDVPVYVPSQNGEAHGPAPALQRLPPSGFHSSTAWSGPASSRLAQRDGPYAKYQHQGSQSHRGSDQQGRNASNRQPRETSRTVQYAPQASHTHSQSQQQPHAHVNQGQRGPNARRQQGNRNHTESAASSSSAPSSNPPTVSIQRPSVAVVPKAPQVASAVPLNAEPAKINHSPVSRIASASQGKNRVILVPTYKIQAVDHPKGLSTPYFRCEMRVANAQGTSSRTFFSEGSSARAVKNAAAKQACSVFLGGAE